MLHVSPKLSFALIVLGEEYKASELWLHYVTAFVCVCKASLQTENLYLMPAHEQLIL
jgi:hypothetical protein